MVDSKNVNRWDYLVFLEKNIKAEIENMMHSFSFDFKEHGPSGKPMSYCLRQQEEINKRFQALEGLSTAISSLATMRPAWIFLTDTHMPDDDDPKQYGTTGRNCDYCGVELPKMHGSTASNPGQTLIWFACCQCFGKCEIGESGVCTLISDPEDDGGLDLMIWRVGADGMPKQVLKADGSPMLITGPRRRPGRGRNYHVCLSKEKPGALVSAPGHYLSSHPTKGEHQYGNTKYHGSTELRP